MSSGDRKLVKSHHLDLFWKMRQVLAYDPGADSYVFKVSEVQAYHRKSDPDTGSYCKGAILKYGSSVVSPRTAMSTRSYVFDAGQRVSGVLGFSLNIGSEIQLPSDPHVSADVIIPYMGRLSQAHTTYDMAHPHIYGSYGVW